MDLFSQDVMQKIAKNSLALYSVEQFFSGDYAYMCNSIHGFPMPYDCAGLASFVKSLNEGLSISFSSPRQFWKNLQKIYKQNEAANLSKDEKDLLLSSLDKVFKNNEFDFDILLNENDGGLTFDLMRFSSTFAAKVFASENNVLKEKISILKNNNLSIQLNYLKNYSDVFDSGLNRFNNRFIKTLNDCAGHFKNPSISMIEFIKNLIEQNLVLEASIKEVVDNIHFSSDRKAKHFKEYTLIDSDEPSLKDQLKKVSIVNWNDKSSLLKEAVHTACWEMLRETSLKAMTSSYALYELNDLFDKHFQKSLRNVEAFVKTQHDFMKSKSYVNNQDELMADVMLYAMLHDKVVSSSIDGVEWNTHLKVLKDYLKKNDENILKVFDMAFGIPNDYFETLIGSSGLDIDSSLEPLFSNNFFTLSVESINKDLSLDEFGKPLHLFLRKLDNLTPYSKEWVDVAIQYPSITKTYIEAKNLEFKPDLYKEVVKDSLVNRSDDDYFKVFYLLKTLTLPKNIKKKDSFKYIQEIFSSENLDKDDDFKRKVLETLFHQEPESPSEIINGLKDNFPVGDYIKKISPIVEFFDGDFLYLKTYVNNPKIFEKEGIPDFSRSVNLLNYFKNDISSFVMFCCCSNEKEMVSSNNLNSVDVYPDFDEFKKMQSIYSSNIFRTLRTSNRTNDLKVYGNFDLFLKVDEFLIKDVSSIVSCIRNDDLFQNMTIDNSYVKDFPKNLEKISNLGIRSPKKLLKSLVLFRKEDFEKVGNELLKYSKTNPELVLFGLNFIAQKNERLSNFNFDNFDFLDAVCKVNQGVRFDKNCIFSLFEVNNLQEDLDELSSLWSKAVSNERIDCHPDNSEKIKRIMGCETEDEYLNNFKLSNLIASDDKCVEYILSLSDQALIKDLSKGQIKLDRLINLYIANEDKDDLVMKTFNYRIDCLVERCGKESIINTYIQELNHVKEIRLIGEQVLEKIKTVPSKDLDDDQSSFKL